LYGVCISSQRNPGPKGDSVQRFTSYRDQLTRLNMEQSMPCWYSGGGKTGKMLAVPHKKLEEVESTQSKGKVVARDLKVVDFLLGI
jgi:hypothetical protein